MTRIEPRTLKGFQDLLPEHALRRADMVRRIEDVFRAHGYAPIDTPSLEYAEILKGKGGEETDKQLFEFDDAGGRRVALRFDLTVPLARFVAQHHAELALPFRRYHVGHVWRGERPQKGRFREFLQCDADLVGATGVAADAEVLVTMLSAYEALGVGGVTLRVNDRRVLQGLLGRLDAADRAVPVLRALDKRAKQGDEVVAKELAAAGLKGPAVETLLDLARPRGDDVATVAALEIAVKGNPVGEAALHELVAVKGLVLAAGKRPGSIVFDPGIARGLDYYTGIVLEAELDAFPGIGSVGSGGRYDDLAGLYTAAKLPGVGCSIGLDRLLAALAEKGEAAAPRAGPDAMVAHAGDAALARAFGFAQGLRDGGLRAEVFPEERKHAAQMKYADRRGIRFVFTPDPGGSFHGKDLVTGETFDVDAAAAALAEMRARWTRSGPA
jgi:histidyl-tRNA synthetase